MIISIRGNQRSIKHFFLDSLFISYVTDSSFPSFMMILSWVYSSKKDFVFCSLDMSQPIISHIYHSESEGTTTISQIEMNRSQPHVCTAHSFQRFLHFSKGTQDGMETCGTKSQAQHWKILLFIHRLVKAFLLMPPGDEDLP